LSRRELQPDVDAELETPAGATDVWRTRVFRRLTIFILTAHIAWSALL
jgi:hypothetical protein